MKNFFHFLINFIFCIFSFGKIQVVATLPNYSFIAQEIGKEKVEAKAIVLPDQDPHYVRAKPSFALMLQKADLFITTGLDLELWVPSLLDKASNKKILEGEKGYCIVSEGVPLEEVPKAITRAAGDIHIYGNPHFYNSPVHLKIGAKNILDGLIRVDPENESYYKKNYDDLINKFNEKIYGKELLSLIEVKKLDEFVLKGNFWEEIKKAGLQDKVGGWLQKAKPLNKIKVVNYHKMWVYFCRTFGMEISSYVEPKPGIPPSPKDVEKLINSIKVENVSLIFDTTYYREDQMKKISDATKIPYAQVPAFVGDMGTKDYFELIEKSLDLILSALKGNK